MVDNRAPISALVIRAVHILREADKLHRECEHLLGMSIKRSAATPARQAGNEQREPTRADAQRTSEAPAE